MAEQQAAEALVAVGRQNSGGGGNTNPSATPGGGDDSMFIDTPDDAPKKKRARKSKKDMERDAEMERSVAALQDPERIQPAAPRSVESSGSPGGDSPSRWIDDSAMNEPSPVASHPSHQQSQTSQQQQQSSHGQSGAHHSPPYTQPPAGEERYPALSRGRFASPHGGLELPPLNAALTGHIGGGRSEGEEGASASYRKSGSNQSPPGHPRSPSSYHLPPPNFFHGQTSSGPGPIRTQHRSYSPTIHTGPYARNRSGSGSRSPPLGVPTIAELEHHYGELRAERRRLEDLLATTDRMISGLKRGLDEMRAASGETSPVAGPGSGPGSGAGSGGSGSGSGESLKDTTRPKSGERAEKGSVWAWEASSSNTHS